MTAVKKCLSCGFMRLASEIDPDTGQGSCCPSSKRVPRSDRGERRTRLSVSKNLGGGGREKPPSSEQFKLF